jgi:hypothetical protein
MGLYGLYRASVPVQYSYTSTPPVGRTACTEPQCLYSTAIPLLPLWTVRPVQSLSSCTVQLHLYSPYGPYSLYRASVPVPRASDNPCSWNSVSRSLYTTVSAENSGPFHGCTDTTQHIQPHHHRINHTPMY